MASAALTIDQAREIHAAYQYRREHFTHETSEDSLLVALLNFGEQYAPVACIAGEWSGTKSDLARVTGIPKCPNGHVLTQGPGLQLALVPEGGA